MENIIVGAIIVVFCSIAIAIMVAVIRDERAHSKRRQAILDREGYEVQVNGHNKLRVLYHVKGEHHPYYLLTNGEWRFSTQNHGPRQYTNTTNGKDAIRKAVRKHQEDRVYRYKEADWKTVQSDAPDEMLSKLDKHVEDLFKELESIGVYNDEEEFGSMGGLGAGK